MPAPARPRPGRGPQRGAPRSPWAAVLAGPLAGHGGNRVRRPWGPRGPARRGSCRGLRPATAPL